RRERALQRGHVERQRVVIDVDEDRPRPGHHDRGGRGDEREGGRDHLVSGPDAERGEGQAQRVGARADAHAVTGPAHRRQLGLERAPLRPEDEGAVVDHARSGLEQLGPERLVLPPQVEKWNHRCPLDSMAPRPTLLPIGPPTPRRFTAKRISSSRWARLTYSMVSAQHCQWKSAATRVSVKRSRRRSQLIDERTVTRRESWVFKAPCRKVILPG